MIAPSRTLLYVLPVNAVIEQDQISTQSRLQHLTGDEGPEETLPSPAAVKQMVSQLVSARPAEAPLQQLQMHQCLLQRTRLQAPGRPLVHQDKEAALPQMLLLLLQLHFLELQGQQHLKNLLQRPSH